MGNNIVIATSSDLYDQMNSQIQEDQKLILSQIKEISRLTSENLKNSILYEGAKRESTNLRDQKLTRGRGPVERDCFHAL
jgi:hypothetical protein